MSTQRVSALVKTINSIIITPDGIKSLGPESCPPCEITRENIQEQIDLYTNRVLSGMITCGGCGTNAIVSPDTTYERTVILDENDISDPIHVTITVIKCSNKKCEQKYHALLPDWICPFLPYTYEFIAKVMDYFYNEANENIQKTAKFFQLNRKTVRRFRVLVEGLGVELRMTELFQTLEFSLALLFQNLADKKNWAEAAKFRKSFVERCGRAFMAVKTTYLHNHKVYTYTYTPIGV